MSGQLKIAIDVESKVATLEIEPEMLTETLEEALEKLHSWRGQGELGALVLFIVGKKYPTAKYSKLIQTGAFFEGLRAIGVPVVASVDGIVEGPMWLAVMNADYRVSSNKAVYSMPLHGDPRDLMNYLGQEPAKKCIVELGNWSSLKALEVGIIQSTQPRAENAKREAFEIAKRILRFPNLVGRKDLMGPPGEEVGRKTCYRRINLDGPPVL